MLQDPAVPILSRSQSRSQSRSRSLDRTRRSFQRVKQVAALLLVLASLAVTVPAGALQGEPSPDELADELIEEGLVRLDSVEGGVLLLETDEPGWYVPAPALHTDIDVAVSGPIARTTVSQRFHNSAHVFVEGTYLFPLPEGAAVDTLRMRVGDRWIEGRVEEREEARIVYEEAKAAGQVASLVEQQRPNAFTTSVANIAPGADVVVQIEYQQSLAPRDGAFGLRLPLVVAPRYVPGDQRAEHELRLTESGWKVDTTISTTAAAVTSPIADPRNYDPRIDQQGMIRNPVEITIDLDAGFPLATIDSPYHDIVIKDQSQTTASIAVDGPIPADRDFYLSWTPAVIDEPYLAMFSEQHNNERHFIAMLTPPSAETIAETRQPREVIFVQDTSGSMEGESMAQAKAGLVEGLERLTEDDVFNVIEFDSDYTSFARDPVPASEKNIRLAIRWVDGLVADKGTEMRPALEEALTDSTPNDGRLRQVIFLTDGAVSNEEDMLNLIERELGKSRLFTVGIGSAPNSYFMTAAARSGRGSFVFIGDLGEVNDQMQALFSKIETPAVVGLEVEDLPIDVAVSPYPIPDLYAGDPIVLTVQLPEGADMDTLKLVGTQGDSAWRLDVKLDQAVTRDGVSKLWAREHIRDLEALRVSPLLTQDQRDFVETSVLETALEYGLVSRLTSLVAVDLEITRPADAQTASTDIATNLPAGWDPAIFATEPDDAEPELSEQALSRLDAAEESRAAAQEGGAGGAAGVDFAATGADWQLQALVGLAIMASGAAVSVVTGRRRHT